MPEGIYLILAFAIMAFLYASIGHGGASAYLALMAVSGIGIEFLRPSALIMNLFVSAFSFLFFIKKHKLKYSLLLILLISSLPAAYFGGKTQIDASIFQIILAGFLLFASFRLLFKLKKEHVEKDYSAFAALLVGGVLGFFSGLIGIGGGIILSPILLLLGWSDAKESAVISAAFIWLNSLFGLLGLYSAGALHPHPELMYWIPAVIAGGLIGAYAGSHSWKEKSIRIVLSLVLITASVKLLLF